MDLQVQQVLLEAQVQAEAQELQQLQVRQVLLEALA
jgi:hypothetical protein